jgi:TolB protein
MKTRARCAGVLVVLLSFGTSCRDVSAPGAPPPSIPPLSAPPAPPIPTQPDGAIYLATVDGAAPTLLTRGYGPAWAPDGRRLALYRGDGSVYVVEADGGGEHRLAEGHEPRIVFTRRDGISVMDADGSHVTTLVRREFAAGRYPDASTAVGAPVWSPDGRIAFLLLDVDTGSSLEILVVSAGGGDARTVVVAGAGTGGPTQASWSPDGARLAYSNWEGQAGITVRDLGGAAPDVRYRDPAGTGYVGAPVWSPDGSSLAFTVPVLSVDKLPLPGRSEVWLEPAAGGSARLLIRDATSPAWSPDGARIAFVGTASP